jgi:membrane associated rhomboid family serine protease
MFFIFPYATDAPVYYWPFATLGLIVLNVTIFLAMVTGQIYDVESWILAYGDGLHPTQWVTSLFMHGGFEHLIGNMLFLWVFGLVVEGKLGWWRFLSCYLGIGAVQSMLEQIVMLGYTGDVPGSFGASATIFGLMAMAAVWAPMNDITFFFLLFIRAGTFDVSILMMAAFYTGLELCFAFIFGGGAGSSLLHLSGMALGLPLGIVLLKRGVVDCEGWDLFHVWRGDYGAFKQEPDLKDVSETLAVHQQQRDQRQLTDAKSQLREYLRQGNIGAAVSLYGKMRDVRGGLTLDRGELLTIIKGLHAASRWTDSAPFMADLIERFPDGADLVRVKLAQICVVELQRPGKALELLAKVDAARLPGPQLALAKKIAAKARQMQAEGVFELDTDTW